VAGLIISLGAASLAHSQVPAPGRGPATSGRIEIADLEHVPYAGSTLRALAVIWRTGATVNNPTVGLRWHSSDLSRAWITDDGTLSLFKPGEVTLTATHGDLLATKTIIIAENPIAKVKLSGDPQAEVRVGTPIRLSARLTSTDGRPITDARVNFGIDLGDVVRDPRSAQITEEGVLTVTEPGVYTVIGEFGGKADRITMLIGMPGINTDAAADDVADFELEGGNYAAFVGSNIPLSARVVPRGSKRPLRNPRVHWASSDEDVAWVGQNGVVVFTGPGRVTISAEYGKRTATRTFEVERNPAARLVLLTNVRDVHATDTVNLRTEIWARGGQPVRNARVTYAVIPRTPNTEGGATVLEGGRFVAKTPGVYTILAEFGGLADTRTIMVQAPLPPTRKASRGRDR
jgi:hypothetical protein